MSPRRLVLGFALALGVVSWFLPRPAEAIPAFARRYRISCTTCHAPFPRLKPYGDEFAGNGMVIPEEETERHYVTGGDDLLWLNKDFPVAVRMDLYGVWEQKNDVETDFQVPWGLKLLSGGAVAKNIGYYFYFYMSERGEVAGIEDAYLQFNDVLVPGLAAMVGQFQTSDPLMKRELRLTYEDYQVYRARVGASATDLTYDRGVMLTYGIAATGTDLVAMAVNGNGKPEAEENHKFDQDSHKSYGLRVVQGVGDALSIGGFVYYGQEDLRNEDALLTNDVVYYGPDVALNVGPAALTVQYLRREDTAPGYPTRGDESVITDGVVAELVLAPQGDLGRHFITLLYNWVDSDVEDKLEFGDVDPVPDYAGDYQTATASVTYLLRRNVRAVVEFTYDFEREINRAALGFVSAF
jgi:hypothetical protein